MPKPGNLLVNVNNETFSNCKRPKHLTTQVTSFRNPNSVKAWSNCPLFLWSCYGCLQWIKSWYYAFYSICRPFLVDFGSFKLTFCLC
uniref:Uncharacterized protein n=1 Tax=Picea sitchensis TaxID=3332 RepID=A9NX22_PICSI|nr:unknown [Picea sitchensis]